MSDRVKLLEKLLEEAKQDNALLPLPPNTGALPQYISTATSAQPQSMNRKDSNSHLDLEMKIVFFYLNFYKENIFSALKISFNIKNHK